MSDSVYLLMRADWSGPFILTAFTTKEDAEATLAAIVEESKRHRDYEDTAHHLEVNLYIEECSLRPEGDRSLSFEELTKR